MSPNGVVRQLVTRLTFQVDNRRLDGFRRRIDGIKSGLNQFSNGFRSFAGFASRLALTVSGLITSVGVFANYLAGTETRLQSLGRQTGVQRERLESLRIAFNGLGVSSESFQTILGNLGQGLSQARLGYGPLLEFTSRIGINLRNSNGQLKETDDLFLELLDYARSISNPSLQTSFIERVFGKVSPEDAIRLLSRTREEIESLATSSSDLQTNVTPQDRQQLEDFQRNFSELKALVARWTSQVTFAILPGLNTAIRSFVRIGKGVRDLRVYFTELADALYNLFNPIADALSNFGNFVAPEGSTQRKWYENFRKSAANFLFNSNQPYEDVNSFSDRSVGIGALNSTPIVNNITVNTTVPAGTSMQQAQFIEDTTEQSWESVGANLNREMRQMTNSNALPAY